MSGKHTETLALAAMVLATRYLNDVSLQES